MSELEDLSGRRFRWLRRSGFPLHLDILDREEVIGFLKPSNNLPTASAWFQGINWQLRRTREWHGGSHFSLAFAQPGSSTTSLATVDWSFSGKISTVVDGVRRYEMVAPSCHIIEWVDEAHWAAVQFRKPWDTPSPMIPEGTILVGENCVELDAAPLMLLGIFLIYEISPFRPEPE